MSIVESRSKTNRAFDIVNVTIILLFTLSCVFPIYYVFIYSLSTPALVTSSVRLLPVGFTFENFARVFQLNYLPNSFIVSAARAVSGTLLSVFCCSFYAFLLRQKELPLRKFFYRMMIVTMYVGGGMIPTYILMINLGFRNNFLVYIVPGALGAYNVILIRTYMENVSVSLEESAKIDGAGPFRTYAYIVVPICVPILATIAVFTAVGQWNSWFDNMLYINKRHLYCAQYLLYTYNQEAESLAKKLAAGDMQQRMLTMQDEAKNFVVTPMSVRMTLTMFVVLPILFVYPFMQRFFVKGIMVGAIKG